jgi:hypothetical protein
VDQINDIAKGGCFQMDTCYLSGYDTSKAAITPSGAVHSELECQLAGLQGLPEITRGCVAESGYIASIVMVLILEAVMTSN